MWRTFCAQWWVLVHVSIVANNAVLLLRCKRPFFRKVRRLATCELQQRGTRLDGQRAKTRMWRWSKWTNTHPHMKGIVAGESPLVAEAYGAARSRVLHMREGKYYSKHTPLWFMEGMWSGEHDILLKSSCARMCTGDWHSSVMWQPFYSQWWVLVQVSFVANSVVLLLWCKRPFFRKVRRLAKRRL